MRTRDVLLCDLRRFMASPATEVEGKALPGGSDCFAPSGIPHHFPQKKRPTHFELSDNLNSKIIAFAFSLAAEIERNLISTRTREALAAKKMAGVKLGRPPGYSKEKQKFEKKREEILKARENGTTIFTLAAQLNIHPNTLSRYLKEANSSLIEYK